jgi:hypothetical protein
MVYKKYIERNGKIYGPYVYHSRRVDGKVISEYHGSNKKTNRRRILFIIALPIIIISLILWSVFFQPQFTGRIVLDLNQDVSEEFQGNINLVLKEGELIPMGTKIIIENGGEIYESFLEDFIDLEEIDGNYYLQDTDVLGNGAGFGIIGKTEKTVSVFFQLKIREKDSLEKIDKSNDLDLEEELSDDVTGESLEKVIEEKEESIDLPTTLTGSVVKRIGGIFSNSFTGNVVSEKGIIQGDVSKGKEFKQTISAGETVEIIEGSVMAEDGKLDLNVLNLVVENNQIIVTTNYSKIDKGFGKNYLGKTEMEISIPLNSLNIDFEVGPIIIKGIHEEVEIFSYEKEIKETTSLEEIAPSNENINEINEIIINKKNLTDAPNNFPPTEIIQDGIDLNEKEISILMKKFGTIEIRSFVQKYRDKYLVELTIGKFSLKHYYSNSLKEEELKIEIEKDKIIWLKDLAREFGKEDLILEEVVF